MAEHGRDPCPIVIVNDFGGAFAMGVSICGAAEKKTTPEFVGLWQIMCCDQTPKSRFGQQWR